MVRRYVAICACVLDCVVSVSAVCVRVSVSVRIRRFGSVGACTPFWLSEPRGGTPLFGNVHTCSYEFRGVHNIFLL